METRGINSLVHRLKRNIIERLDHYVTSGYEVENDRLYHNDCCCIRACCDLGVLATVFLDHLPFSGLLCSKFGPFGLPRH